MTDAPQPTSGSLEAKIIRACQAHGNTCKLTCPKRQVEDLGQIANFQTRPSPTLPNPKVGLRTGKPPEPTIFHQLGHWLERITHTGGASS